MKNSIRLFCILLGVCYILSIGNGFLEFAEGWSEASHDVIEQKDGEEIHRVNLDLKPLAGNIFPDTLQLSSGDKFPYQLSAVTVAHKTSDTYQLISVLMGFIGTPVILGLGIWALLSFAYFIRDVQRQQIFIRPNIRRLRVICIALVLVGVLENLFSGIDHYFLLKQSGIAFPGYSIADFAFKFRTFFIALLFGLFAEIFALGVKLKEEQELTV